MGEERNIGHRKTVKILAVLLLVVFFHFFNNLFWLKMDVEPTGIDTSMHLVEAAKFKLAIQGIVHSSLSPYEKIILAGHVFRTWPSYQIAWPSLIYALTFLICPSQFNLFYPRLYVNFIFFFIMIFSTYFLGKRVVGRKGGLLAAITLSFYPAIYSYSRQFGLDFPLAAMTTLCLALLVFSEYFSKRYYALLFGLVFGVTTLIKLQVILFFVCPLIYVMVKILTDSAMRGKVYRFLNIFFSGCLFFSVFYFFWFDKVTASLSFFLSHAFALYGGFSGWVPPSLGWEKLPVFSLRSLTYYLGQMVDQLSFPVFLIFLFSLANFIRSKVKDAALLLSFFVGGYLIFTFLSVKWARYDLPLLPFSALVISWAFFSLRDNRVRKVVCWIAMLYFMILFIGASWFGAYEKFVYFEPESVYADPDRTNGYADLLKQSGLVESIRGRLTAGEFVRVRFTGPSNVLALPFHCLLQGYLANPKIDIQEADDSEMSDATYVLFDSRVLNPGDEILKHFSVMGSSEDGGAYVLQQK